MKRTLRFKVHELTPLKPLTKSGKYIGKNPFTNRKDDLIVNDHHNYIQIKSDGFVGDWVELQRNYRNDLIKIWEKGFNIRDRKKTSSNIDHALQRKLFKIDNEIEGLTLEILKFKNKFSHILKSAKRNKLFYDNELDITIKFHISNKHRCYNKNDDNIVYEDDFWNFYEIDNRTKYSLDRRESYYFKLEGLNPKYQKKDWSSLTYYLFSNCSREDIMCIDKLFIDIKPIVQLSKDINKSR